MSDEKLDKPYYLMSDGLAEQVATLAAGSRPFWTRIGPKIIPKYVFQPAVRHVLEAVNEIVIKYGKPPANVELVKHYLRTRAGDTKLSFAETERAIGVLSDPSELDPDLIADILVPMLKDHTRRDVAIAGIQALQEVNSMDNFLKQAEEWDSLGEGASVGDMIVSADGLVSNAPPEQHRKTRIHAIDTALQGGLRVPALVTWGARDKGGKSIALTSQAARDFEDSLFVGVLSLELDVPLQKLRIAAALAKQPITQLIRGDLHCKRAVMDATEKALGGGGGLLVVERFAGKHANLLGVQSWVERVEDRAGRKVDTLIIDYAGKMKERTFRGDTYHEKEHIWEGLYEMAHNHDRLVVTAAQGVRSIAKVQPGKDTPVMTAGDFADSQFIVRVSDHSLTINPCAEGMVRIFIASDRHYGAGGTMTPHLPHAFHIGHIVDPTFDPQEDEPNLFGELQLLH